MNKRFYEFKKVRREVGLKEGYSHLMMSYLYTGAMPAMVILGLRMLHDGIIDDDQDDAYADDLLFNYFWQNLNQELGLFPVVGTGLKSAISMWDDKPFDDRLSTPALGLIEGMIKTAPQSYKYLSEDKGQSGKVAADAITTMSVIMGVPAAAVIRKPVKYMLDVSEGKKDPSQHQVPAYDAFRGLVTGK